MRILAIIVSIILIIGILQDSFEAIVLPRRVSRRFRLSRWFYTSTWVLWSKVARKMRPGNRREFYLSYYGPLSLIVSLVICAAIIIVDFALFQLRIRHTLQALKKLLSFVTCLYIS